MHFPELANLAARAWHETKGEGDPEFNECALTHRENLIAAAKAIVDGGLPSDPSNVTITAFDVAVNRLVITEREQHSKVEQIAAENPNLHGDEVMHIASGVPHPLAHAEHQQLAEVREEFRPSPDVFVAESLPSIFEPSKGAELSGNAIQLDKHTEIAVGMGKFKAKSVAKKKSPKKPSVKK